MKLENLNDSRYSKKALKFLTLFLLFFFSSPTFARGDCPASLKELNAILSTPFPRKVYYPLFIELVENLTTMTWPKDSPLKPSNDQEIYTPKELYLYLKKELQIDASRIQRVRGKSSSSANDLSEADRKVLLLVYEIAVNKDQDKAQKLGLLGPDESINDLFYVQSNKTKNSNSKINPRNTDLYQEKRAARRNKEDAKLSDKSLEEAFEQIKNDSRISPQMLAKAWDLSIPQIYKMMDGSTSIKSHEWHILKTAKDFEGDSISLAELKEKNYISALEAEAIEKTIDSNLAKKQGKNYSSKDLKNLQVLLSTNNYAFSFSLKRRFRKILEISSSHQKTIDDFWVLENAPKVSDQEFKELRDLFEKEEKLLEELRHDNKYPPTEAPFTQQHEELKKLLLRDVLKQLFPGKPKTASLEEPLNKTQITELVNFFYQKENPNKFLPAALTSFLGAKRPIIIGWATGRSLPKIDQQVRILALIKAMGDRDMPTLKKYFSEPIKKELLDEKDIKRIVDHFHQNLANS